MGEVQEKCWVVIRSGYKIKKTIGRGTMREFVFAPVKVFDDREDARKYAGRMQLRSASRTFRVHGVKKG